MKKIWKNLCVCSLAVACSAGLTACGREKPAVSVDLDGDGVISSWENLFDKTSDAEVKDVTSGTFVYINNADELININQKTIEEPNTSYTYILKKDINLGGQSVYIDLGVSELYGYNHTISNFKLGTVVARSESGVEVNANNITQCLFYNGKRVSGVKVFMGVQNLSVDKQSNVYSISPFYNVPSVSQVSVKGKINVNAVDVQGRVGTAQVHASLLSNTSVDDTTGESLSVNIREVGVEGVINVTDEQKNLANMYIGGIASVLGKDAYLYDAFSSVEINATASNALYCGEIVGRNNGFVSTAIATGRISVSSMSNTLEQNIGGIAGYNGNLAELRNCSTNTEITYNSDQMINYGFALSNNFVYGGIVGVNDGGILECAQSDAKIVINNLYKITAGGICGNSKNGIVSYVICRGELTFNNVGNVRVAHTIGESSRGYVEKVIATTPIKINNATTNNSKLYVGMLTTFESDSVIAKTGNTNEGYARMDFDACPNMRNILVTGDTEVNVMGNADGQLFYNLGLRNAFKAKEQISIDGEEEGDVITEERTVETLPHIFKDVYYTNEGAKLNVYAYGTDRVKENINIKYNAKITTSEPTMNNLIDRIGFKNFLNHNEVNLDIKVVLSTLHFTLDEKTADRSYFGGSVYNGELAYFDKYFDGSVVHDTAGGGCEQDTEDELMSFLYSFLRSARSGDCVALKFNKSFFNINWSEYDNSGDFKINDLSLLSDKLFRSVEGALKCLNLFPESQILDTNKEQIIEISKTARYIQFNFSESNENYKILFDVYSLENFEGNDIVNKDNYIVYITMM